MTHYIQDAELDLAVAQRKVEITGRSNARAVRCARAGCRRWCGEGQARRVFIDGHRRGFLCTADAWAVQKSTMRQGGHRDHD